MGRFIVTEEEVKQIRNLYEMDNSQTPPPDEKELVVSNKNPFKYSEYEDARRLYSPELKDGERFYEQKSLSPLIKELYRKTFFGNDSIDVKTLRDATVDKIYTISLRHPLFTDRHLDSFEINFRDEGEIKRLIVSLDGSHDRFRISTNTFSPSRELTDIDKKVFGPVIEIIRKQMNEFNSKIDELQDAKNIINIPDEFFDIYKVKRVKTDF